MLVLYLTEFWLILGQKLSKECILETSPSFNADTLAHDQKFKVLHRGSGMVVSAFTRLYTAHYPLIIHQNPKRQWIRRSKCSLLPGFWITFPLPSAATRYSSISHMTPGSSWVSRRSTLVAWMLPKRMRSANSVVRGATILSRQSESRDMGGLYSRKIVSSFATPTTLVLEGMFPKSIFPFIWAFWLGGGVYRALWFGGCQHVNASRGLTSSWIPCPVMLCMYSCTLTCTEIILVHNRMHTDPFLGVGLRRFVISGALCH